MGDDDDTGLKQDLRDHDENMANCFQELKDRDDRYDNMHVSTQEQLHELTLNLKIQNEQKNAENLRQDQQNDIIQKWMMHEISMSNKGLLKANWKLILIISAIVVSVFGASIIGNPFGG